MSFEMAERFDIMSSVKLDRFWSQLEASCVSNHTERASERERERERERECVCVCV